MHTHAHHFVRTSIRRQPCRYAHNNLCVAALTLMLAASPTTLACGFITTTRIGNLLKFYCRKWEKAQHQSLTHSHTCAHTYRNARLSEDLKAQFHLTTNANNANEALRCTIVVVVFFVFVCRNRKPKEFRTLCCTAWQ